MPLRVVCFAPTRNIRSLCVCLCVHHCRRKITILALNIHNPNKLSYVQVSRVNSVLVCIICIYHSDINARSGPTIREDIHFVLSSVRYACVLLVTLSQTYYKHYARSVYFRACVFFLINSHSLPLFHKLCLDNGKHLTKCCRKCHLSVLLVALSL